MRKTKLINKKMDYNLSHKIGNSEKENKLNPLLLYKSCYKPNDKFISYSNYNSIISIKSNGNEEINTTNSRIKKNQEKREKDYKKIRKIKTLTTSFERNKIVPVNVFYFKNLKLRCAINSPNAFCRYNYFQHNPTIKFKNYIPQSFKTSSALSLEKNS